MKRAMNTKQLLLLFYFVLSNSCNENQSTNSQVSPFDEKTVIAKVIEVYDGDTFLASYKSAKEKIRVLNIDCYETSYGTRLEEQAKKNGISVDSAYQLGIQAKRLADSLLKGFYVSLIRDYNLPNRDVYNRLLRLVLIQGMKYDSIIISKNLNAN